MGWCRMDVVGHFGLAYDPFRATIDPQQAYQSRPFSAARQQVLAGLTRGARLIAVAGGAGAGKTLLLRDLERALAGRGSVLRTERPDTASAALSSPAEALLVDDADAIDETAFATLIDRAASPNGPSLVLACPQRGLDRLPASGVLTISLPFLAPDEARAFLVDRVIRAGGNAAIFDVDALDLLAEASRGIPAALRQLGANALFQAAFDGATHVREAHARQAAAMTQDMWRSVAAPELAKPPAPAVGPTVAMAAPAAVAEAITPERPLGRPRPDEAPTTVQRSWWRNAPPLIRMAMIVGLLLLSLPVLGYLVGTVKDDRPATESSYLPDDEGADAAAEDAEVAQATPDAAAVDPSIAMPAETVGDPEDLTAATRVANAAPEPPAGQAAAATPPEPIAAPPEILAEPEVAAAEPEEAVAPPDVAPAAGGPRVFVHYSTSQAGADEAAADVARELRERGFAVADIRAVPGRIETASVRYFHSGDRGDAEALHDALGVALRGRGFSAGDLKSMTDYRPAPRRGTIEVWVPAGG